MTKNVELKCTAELMINGVLSDTRGVTESMKITMGRIIYGTAN